MELTVSATSLEFCICFQLFKYIYNFELLMPYSLFFQSGIPKHVSTLEKNINKWQALVLSDQK